MIKLVNAVGTEKVLAMTMALPRIPLDIDVPSQPLYGLDGDVQTGRATLRSRQFVLEGSVYYPSKGRIEQELDSLLSFLMKPPIEVYRHHRHNHFLRAVPVGAPQDWLGGGAELRLRVPMIALDPYWYGAEVTETMSGTQTIEVDGTAPTPPLVTVSGNVTIFHLQTGAEIVISGASGLVEIDNQDFVIKVAGQENLGIVNDDWLLHGFMLLPGQNLITTNKSIVLTYRPRWY